MSRSNDEEVVLLCICMYECVARVERGVVSVSNTVDSLLPSLSCACPVKQQTQIETFVHIQTSGQKSIRPNGGSEWTPRKHNRKPDPRFLDEDPDGWRR